MTVFDAPLWFLALIPVAARLVWIVLDRRKNATAFRYSSLALIQRKPSMRVRTRWIPVALETLALVLVIVALARPQVVESRIDEQRGIDMVIVLDASGSMAAEDFRPRNRFTVAKELIDDFITSRFSDRIGVITFGTRAATRVPVTFDRMIARNTLDEARVGENGDGTAIGQAVATAVNRLRPSEAESRVMILLTDGVNNAGSIDPMTAAELATRLGIRIYTIGVGSRGPVPIPVRVQDALTGQITTRYQFIRADLDDEMLTRMAEMTGGQYFRATDEQALSAILQRIDELETSDLGAPKRHVVHELYVSPLAAGIVLLLLSIIGGETLWMRLPV
ncbi:MAG: VWA domain-containing protein, partial [Thermoanaerobaculia bacterium]|nr:VWA domain-containing protein [Thermoanaerobaculia bacterium]